MDNQRRLASLPPVRWTLANRITRRLDFLLFWAIGRRKLANVGKNSVVLGPSLIIGGKHIHIGERVEIGPNARIEARVDLRHGIAVRIGNGSKIQPNLHIGAALSVSIGEGVLIASGVYITDHDHDFSDPKCPAVSNKKISTEPVVIGDFAWLGERAIVLKGVTVGRGAIVGAGSVVTKNVPPYSIAAGIPARVVKKFDEKTETWVSL